MTTPEPVDTLAPAIANPSATGSGRLTMAPATSPYDDIDGARAGATSRWVHSLDGEWQFRLRARVDAVTRADVDPDEATDAWDEVAVPGSWVLQGFGTPIYLNIRMPFGGQAPEVPDDNPTGVYRRSFTLPRGWRRRRTLLRIGAANSMGFVWVNGRFAGYGTDSHLASTFEITDLLRAGENVVAVVVPRWSAATWVEDQDQWWMPGLHRSVELVSVPRVALGDTATVPSLDPDGTTGTLDIDVGVDLGSPADGPFTVEVFVEDPGSRGRRPLATTGALDVPLWSAAGEQQEAELAYGWPGHRVVTRLAVAGIEPWHHEHPRRYRVLVALRDGAGRVLDVRTRFVGFRRVELADRALLINGQPVVINGVNHHDIHPDRGPATSRDDNKRDLELMKRHHINAVRTSHYPPDESFLDLCDELGLYVIDEADIETHARWRAIAEDPAYASAFLERAMRMVLRDRSHPSVIAWSLGNESGYGPSHDAMAAWIRRVDPTRVTHYEGGFSRDLDAPNPVSDIVCPMYPPVARIVQWSRDGRDRRPLIPCEYNHAMGQSGGLADYWSVFGAEEGLQGGFVWEWADHGLRRREPDGTEWFAYGGDFGEREHDGRFVCDGLVSPDRVPHPLLVELATLTQPVVVERRGDGRLRITNRRWFTDLADVHARWELAVDGERVAAGSLDVPPIAPRASADVPWPAPRVERAGRATLNVQFTPRHRNRPSWADRDWAVARCTIDASGSDADRVAPARHDRHSNARVPVTVGANGIVLDGIALGWPTVSLWRAPTDNDDPPGEWRPHRPMDEWERHRLDRLVVVDEGVRARGALTTRMLTYRTAVDATIEHHQRLRVLDDGMLQVDERVVIDRAVADLPRVGVGFRLPTDFDALEWLGRGPGDSYPDRLAATSYGRWTSTVAEQLLPFVVPQEYGLHLDTEWFELSSPTLAVRVSGDRPLGFSALAHSAAELTAAAHAHELPPRAATHVQLDVAHRGLGTAACGPDTHARHLVRPGTYRWAWTLTARRR